MGDFSANFHRPDAGIQTVEGTVAGSKAFQLAQQRAKAQEEFSKKKHSALLLPGVPTFAPSATDGSTGGRLGSAEGSAPVTVGLVTAAEFKAATAQAQADAALLAQKRGGGGYHDDDEEGDGKLSKVKRKEQKEDRKKRKKERQKMMSTLSFAGDEDVDEGFDKKQKTSTTGLGKDTSVDTSFLPDRDRDLRVKTEAKRLAREWQAQQQVIRQEQLEITYSYWDGSGHRRTIVCHKGDTVGTFLELIRKELGRTEFRELLSLSSDELLYIKEDLIIPHDYTFYDLIVTKARGKSGPLFHFDVHDDVRVGAPIDSRIEKDESHPGKVCTRTWYERHKHIFPASRWEIYDPTKDYGGYTIHGGVVTTKKK
jgi:protein FAM50